ncbi:MAG: hypothetical protein HY340_04100 [Candidatus Kerfeldbacteria bacterium]|nr:hypothetical protein [Candidatus Kerfeldbacteria bacterium]
MNRNRLLSLTGYASLIVLLVLELVLRYDSWVRQIALAITNIITIIVLLIVSRYLRRRGFALPWAVVWFSALGVWFDGMGNFIHYYANIAWWDKIAHGVGAGALAAGIVVLLDTLIQRGKILLGPVMKFMVAVSLTVTFSVLYEISEYIGDTIYPTNRVTGLFDTADDLLWNLGAAVMVVLVAERFRQKKNDPIRNP